MTSKPLFARSFGSKSVATVVLALLFASGVTSSSANTSVSYDFDTADQLTGQFNSHISSGVFAQSVSGGISDSGSIGPTAASSFSGNAVFASKDSYSIGPVGSSYTFTAFLKSVGNSGYSGMGFTALTPSAENSSQNVAFRPKDALGISVHGGGFVFHNGLTDPQASWSQANPSAPVTRVKAATISDLLNSGSPDKWYRVILKLVRVSNTSFDMRVEVWSTDAAGVLLRPAEADAIFELNNQAAPDLIAAPTISSYINFSGHRVTHFDNYSVELAGGSSVISPGAPVVLSSTATTSAGVVTFTGDVTSEGASGVTERGFVYSTNPNPTLTDPKVVVGSGTGVFTGSTPGLPSGTYYFRAYATNSTATSYGSSLTDSFVGILEPSPSPSPTTAPTSTQTEEPVASPVVAPVTTTQNPILLALTGTSVTKQLWLFGAVFLIGLTLAVLYRRRIRLYPQPSEDFRPRL